MIQALFFKCVFITFKLVLILCTWDTFKAIYNRDEEPKMRCHSIQVKSEIKPPRGSCSPYDMGEL